MKRFGIFIFCLLLISLAMAFVVKAAEVENCLDQEVPIETVTPETLYTEPISTLPTEPYYNIELLKKIYFEPYSYEKGFGHNEEKIETLYSYIDKLNTLVLENFIEAGVPERKAKLIIAKEVARIEEIIIQYQNEDVTWTQHWAEYPVATEIWIYMKEQLGWSDVVAAGVIGNMMVESGGHTLAIKWWSTSGDNSVGICQWKTNYPDRAWLVHANLQQQLDFLKGNVESQMNKWGHLYAKDFTYEDFYNLETPEEAAEAFAVCYERCAPQYVERRFKYAIQAYNYFTA